MADGVGCGSQPGGGTSPVSGLPDIRTAVLSYRVIDALLRDMPLDHREADLAIFAPTGNIQIGLYTSGSATHFIWHPAASIYAGQIRIGTCELYLSPIWYLSGLRPI